MSAVTLSLTVVPTTASAAAGQTGRVYAATGVAWGGIIAMNVAVTKAYNLTPNTFGSNTKGDEGNYKSDQPSLSTNGLMAFASNPSGQWRIYVAQADGSRVRQVTFGDGAVPDDRDPVISPDGSRVAFLSKRGPEAGSPASNMRDIWVVNVDGTGLRRVTTPEEDRTNWSYIRGVDWDDSGRRLAFRGTRLVQEGDAFVLKDVLGFIDATGSRETKIRVDDCAGGSVIDWVGNSVLYSLGGGVQGCYPTKYIVRNVDSGAMVTLENATLGGAANGPGAARLSADQRTVLFSYGLPYYETALVRIGVDGSDRTQVVTKVIAAGVWLWWNPDTFPRLASYAITPKTVRIVAGASTRLTPVLRDTKGRVISKSGADWTWVNAVPGGAISTQGRLTTSASTTPGTYSAQITNAGYTAQVTIVVRAR